MSYEPIFALFWERVKQSIADKTYAKLTLADHGDTEIKTSMYVMKMMYLCFQNIKTEGLKVFTQSMKPILF
jgi:hypothetical protein